MTNEICKKLEELDSKPFNHQIDELLHTLTICELRQFLTANGDDKKIDNDNVIKALHGLADLMKSKVTITEFFVAMSVIVHMFANKNFDDYEKYIM